MNHFNSNSKKWAILTLARLAIVTALYVVITIFLAPISFGVYQLRFSELFNYLVLFDRRYIYSITLGVAIANLGSPLGLADVIIGSASTFIILAIVIITTKRMKNLKIKMVWTAILCSFSMVTIAGELYYFYHYPFSYTWVTVALGELLSMIVGGVLLYSIQKKIDLSN